MPYVYRGVSGITGLPKVDGGECARLVQHYLPEVGHTTRWKPGERVMDVLLRGGTIPPGTAVATFVNRRYPQSGHRHAALYEGAVTSCSYNPQLKRCMPMGFILVDQWNPQAVPASRPYITRRTVNSRGKMRNDGTFNQLSDNAEAFYIIEH